MTVRRMKWHEILWANIRWYSKIVLGLTHTCKGCGCISCDWPLDARFDLQCRVLGCPQRYLHN
jgi:hypothetical protein